MTSPAPCSPADAPWLHRALVLARRGYGRTHPNPQVGAVLVSRRGQLLGEGWHRGAGQPHAEIEALQAARQLGHRPRGSTLFVTLEPCSTPGRTPPCTRALLEAQVRRVVVGSVDPNPRHAGRAFGILHRAGVEVQTGVLTTECTQLNEDFNHWIVRGTPWVTVKAAMTLDGKIATATGESKWITGERARAEGMRLRRGADAILVGVNTILADNPSLTVRGSDRRPQGARALRRIVLDSRARTPLDAKVVTDACASYTTLVTTARAPRRRVAALSRLVNVLEAPAHEGRVDLAWLLQTLGRESIVNLLVEGGGEVQAAFLLSNLAQRIVFFYAPKILGGRESRRAVAGEGVERLEDLVRLREVTWRRLGDDLMLRALVDTPR